MLKKSLAVREKLAEALADAGIRLEEEGGRAGAAAAEGAVAEAPPAPAKGATRQRLWEAARARDSRAAEEVRGDEGEFIVLEDAESAGPSAAPAAPAPRPLAPVAPAAAQPPAQAAQRVAIDPFSLLEDPQLTEQDRRAVAQALWRKLGPNPAFLRYLDYLTPEQVAEVLDSIVKNPQTEVEKLLAEALLKHLGGHGGLR